MCESMEVCKHGSMGTLKFVTMGVWKYEDDIRVSRKY